MVFGSCYQNWSVKLRSSSVIKIGGSHLFAYCSGRRGGVRLGTRTGGRGLQRLRVGFEEVRKERERRHGVGRFEKLCTSAAPVSRRRCARFLMRNTCQAKQLLSNGDSPHRSQSFTFRRKDGVQRDDRISDVCGDMFAFARKWLHASKRMPQSFR